MILELAILNVRPGQENAFEEVFSQAQKIITGIRGYVSHQLHKCIETDSRYVLIVNWETLENHTEDFRGSSDYQEWSKLLHHFYEPFPVVEHYALVHDNKA